MLPPKAYVPTIKGLAKNVFKREPIYPFYASFKVTPRCHFGCPFCNMHTHEQVDLSTEKMKAILDNLSRSPILLTSFEGGEPLLRDDIEELVDYASGCNFYLMFTSSARDILESNIHNFIDKVDFLEVSMDEGHGNLEMFDLLPELTKMPTDVSVQTVVTADTLDSLEEKVEKVWQAGANMVIIPAAEMDGAKKKSFPNIDKFESELRRLKRKYPATIHTPLGYFDAYRKAKCSPASIIISPDGKLFYPCNMKNSKRIDLAEHDLTQWLTSEEAIADRASMKSCDINCGWYQYYSIDAYLSPVTISEALRPAIRRKRR